MRLPEACREDILDWRPCWGDGPEVSALLMRHVSERPFTALHALTVHWPFASGVTPESAGYMNACYPYDDLAILRERLWIACHLLPLDTRFACALSNLCDSVSDGELERRQAGDFGRGPGRATYFTLAYNVGNGDREARPRHLRDRAIFPLQMLLQEVQDRAPAGRASS